MLICVIKTLLQTRANEMHILALRVDNPTYFPTSNIHVYFHWKFCTNRRRFVHGYYRIYFRFVAIDRPIRQIGHGV